MASPPRVAVLDANETCPRLPLVAGDGEAYAVVWPGVGATMRSMHRISLRPRSATIQMRHPMEAVYYVIAGGGMMRDPDTGTAEPVREGSMIHVEPGTAYIAEADAAGLELIGGPCPADPEFYRGLAAKTDR
jgi:mannose-6-phosphate isomerase-like protein (cupin superfamily)